MGDVRFGSPPQTVEEWLAQFVLDNQREARRVPWPWNRKYKAHAWAFGAARGLVLQAETMRESLKAGPASSSTDEEG